MHEVLKDFLPNPVCVEKEEGEQEEGEEGEQEEGEEGRKRGRGRGKS